jgi:hypothetical protein
MPKVLSKARVSTIAFIYSILRAQTVAQLYHTYSQSLVHTCTNPYSSIPFLTFITPPRKPCHSYLNRPLACLLDLPQPSHRADSLHFPGCPDLGSCAPEATPDFPRLFLFSIPPKSSMPSSIPGTYVALVMTRAGCALPFVMLCSGAAWAVLAGGPFVGSVATGTGAASFGTSKLCLTPAVGLGCLT